jgi:hypothetical protein
LAWDPAAAAQAMDEIIADALEHFGGERLWPAHPLDDDGEDNSSIYMGAAGMIWALEYLRRAGANKTPFDFRPYLAQVLEKTRAEMQSYGSYSVTGSLLLGDMETALMIMRLAPSPTIADIVAARANANTELPIRELMWGMAGSMMACLAMSEMTGEETWRRIFETQAERLLGDLEDKADGPIWEQDLYGKHLKFLGPVHGYAGNMLPLMRGWDWLTDGQRARVVDVVPRTLSQHAWRSDLGATWRGTVGQQEPPDLCQYCHGAPGMVTTFADAPFTSPALETLLLDGGPLHLGCGPARQGL